jgi:hypothetical protein
MKRVTEKTRFADICERADIIWRKPDTFDFGKFETEEVGVLSDLFVPDLVVVTYILWGITPKGNRAKCCQFEKIEDRDDYERRNGSVAQSSGRV